ncbi:MAG: shikimate kinase [Planctomycetota bacterium]
MDAHFDGYYDYHPPRHPRIPVTLIGFFGAGHEQIGSTMAALTGLPYTELDRSVEHATGCTVGQLVIEGGEDRYREAEADRLARVLRERPAGIVALGEGALLNAGNRALVSDESVLVYVHREADDLAARLRSQQERLPGAGFPWFPAAGFCDNDFAALSDTRASCYEEATLRVNATGRSADHVADEILGLLELR